MKRDNDSIVGGDVGSARYGSYGLIVTLMKRDNYSTVGGDEGCRVGEVRAGTTSPMPTIRVFLSCSKE